MSRSTFAYLNTSNFAARFLEILWVLNEWDQSSKGLLSICSVSVILVITPIHLTNTIRLLTSAMFIKAFTNLIYINNLSKTHY